jgi:hypothetical protein
MSEPRTPPAVAMTPRLPALSLREARPYLLAPFPATVIGMFAVRKHARAPIARVVFYIPIGYVRARLAFVAGPNGWRLGEPTVLDTRSLSCSLSMFGARHVAVGEGDDRLAQNANGTKQCALLYGVGEFLDAIAPLEFPIGDGPEKATVIDGGHLELTETLITRARAHYASELTRIEPRYGPPLEPTSKPWNTPVSVPRGRARGLAALAASVLDRAERAEDVPAPLRTAVEGLLARAPAGLTARITARRGNANITADTATGERHAEEAAGHVIEVDFAEIGPAQRRWAA